MVGSAVLVSGSRCFGSAPLPQCGALESLRPGIREDHWTVPQEGDITEVLQRLKKGDAGAFDRLLSLVYHELRGLAVSAMKGQRPGHTLQPTALVHEAYLKLLGQTELAWGDRAHFFGVAARAMRQILVDHARRAGAKKRGDGWQRTGTDGVAGKESTSALDLLALDDALSKLAEHDERKAQSVELRYFGGLTVEETARVLGVTTRTVERDWRYALGWLFKEMAAEQTREGRGSS